MTVLFATVSVLWSTAETVQSSLMSRLGLWEEDFIFLPVDKTVVFRMASYAGHTRTENDLDIAAAIERAYIGPGPAPTAVLRVPLITIKDRTRPVNLP